MKFYYNGQLMRTSKSHEYKYAIISPSGDCLSCHSTLEAVQKEFRRQISENETEIANNQKIIKALENGKTAIDLKACGRWHRISLKGKNLDGLSRSDKATWQKYTESHLRRNEWLNTRKIVELEARA